VPAKFLTEVVSNERGKSFPLSLLSLEQKNSHGEKTGTINHNQKNPKSIMAH
jgi:hypothetical protein